MYLSSAVPRLVCIFALAALLVPVAPAQDTPTILQIDVENYVGYLGDTNDPARVARSQTAVTPTAPLNFFSNIILADVTAVNDAPAKGVLVIRTQTLLLSPTPNAGGAIADVTRAAIGELAFELQDGEGSPVGNLYAMGLSGGPAAPGSPAGATSGAVAIVGGAGAFVGARGTLNSVEVANVRSTSQAEDPSKRRANGGGRARFLLQVFPMNRPEVQTGADGPDIFHADGARVGAGRPARRGEVLVVHAKAVAKGLVDVVVGDMSVRAMEPSAPSSQIRFRVPDAVAGGRVPLRVSAGWVKGDAVTIPVEP